jgi:predicted DCC family thiol-disulfide oxidoreductase YuxK
MSRLDEIGCRMLVVYDGHCGFCSGWVRWLLRQDRFDRLRFAPSSDSAVQPLLAKHPELLTADGLPGTVIVFPDPLNDNRRPLSRFAATLALLSQLPRPWPVIAALLGWIPASLSDPVYRLIACYRYRIAGRLESCTLPNSAEQARFL